jgi:hypothetical protein
MRKKDKEKSDEKEINEERKVVVKRREKGEKENVTKEYLISGASNVSKSWKLSERLTAPHREYITRHEAAQ